MRKISVRIPMELYKNMRELVELGYFSSVSEILREALVIYLKEELPKLKSISNRQ